MIRAAGLALALSLLPFVSAASSDQTQVGPGYDIEMSRLIPMRDGVNLAWIFKPSHMQAKAPAVLELTQYDIDGSREQDFNVRATRLRLRASPGAGARPLRRREARQSRPASRPRRL
jgi:hypothetical protein